MIPTNEYFADEILNDFEMIQYPSKTYKVRFEDDNRARGYINDEKEAVKQAIYFILNIERGKHLIYDNDYGIKLVDLFGKDTGYVTAVLPERIKDALLNDDRIEDVTGFEFDVKREKVAVKFKAVTDFGEVESEMVINV